MYIYIYNTWVIRAIKVIGVSRVIRVVTSSRRENTVTENPGSACTNTDTFTSIYISGLSYERISRE